MTEIGDFRLYTIREAAKLLGFSYDGIRQYIKTGKIKARKLGVKYFITEKALKDYFSNDAA